MESAKQKGWIEQGTVYKAGKQWLVSNQKVKGILSRIIISLWITPLKHKLKVDGYLKEMIWSKRSKCSWGSNRSTLNIPLLSCVHSKRSVCSCRREGDVTDMRCEPSQVYYHMRYKYQDTGTINNLFVAASQAHKHLFIIVFPSHPFSPSSLRPLFQCILLSQTFQSQSKTFTVLLGAGLLLLYCWDYNCHGQTE